MEPLEFSEDEIKRQLAALGYFNVSEERMKQFRKDLHKLIEHDRSTTGSSSWFTGVSSPSSSSSTCDSLDKIKRPSQPMLSRFQPHIKVPSRRDALETRSSHNESSWTAQSDLSRVPAHRDDNLYRQSAPQPHAGLLHTTSDGLESLSLEDEARPPLQRIENTHDRLSSDQHSSKFDVPSTSENYSSDSDDSFVPSSRNETKVIRKRKVLRKEVDGTPRVYDESLVEDSSKGLHRIHDISVDDSDPRLARVTARHQLPPRPHSTKPLMRNSSVESFINPEQLPSYIRPNPRHPHTRNLKKTDPVNRYHQYRDFWTNLKAPGEKSHKNLRWEVKAQMMYKEEPAPKPQRVYVPNTYVVPTSKKRSALRWEVRHAMVNGMQIPSTYDVY